MKALTAVDAERFVKIALGHVTRPWPHAVQHVLHSHDDLVTPQSLHPIFYGSFDWHSCVHSYWLIARCIRLFPQIESLSAAIELINQMFTPEKVAGEVAYFHRKGTGGFERPYGWAWLLKLVEELSYHTSPHGMQWFQNIQPLAEMIEQRFINYLPLADYPVRTGVHSNSAFAMILTIDYAARLNRKSLLAICRKRLLRWYENDQNCFAWEPSQNDFLSPSLTEAASMKYAITPTLYSDWLTRFLPNISTGQPATLFHPPVISDRNDGQIAHLDGLNLSRAWCWRMIINTLASDHPAKPKIEDAINRHMEISLRHLADNFMGEHWLATYAMLALGPLDEVAIL